MGQQVFSDKNLDKPRENDIRTLKKLRFLFKFFIFLFLLFMFWQLFLLIDSNLFVVKVKIQLLINAFLSGLAAYILLYLKEKIIDETIEILKNNLRDKNEI